MDVGIVDLNGNSITRVQLKQLNIWNSTTEHICASTLQRLRKLEECDTPISLEIGAAAVVK